MEETGWKSAVVRGKIRSCGMAAGQVRWKQLSEGGPNSVGRSVRRTSLGVCVERCRVEVESEQVRYVSFRSDSFLSGPSDWRLTDSFDLRVLDARSAHPSVPPVDQEQPSGVLPVDRVRKTELGPSVGGQDGLADGDLSWVSVLTTEDNWTGSDVC